jgi:hypothetical protein
MGHERAPGNRSYHERPGRRKMKTPKSIFLDEENLLTNGFEDGRKTAYDAGLVTGRETGYKLGFQDGFSACLKNRNEKVISAEDETARFDLAPNGKRLVGPPCSNCGHCYPALKHCPRCKTPTPVLVECLPQPGAELVE